MGFLSKCKICGKEHRLGFCPDNARLPSHRLHIGADPVIGPSNHVGEDRRSPPHDAVRLNSGNEVRRNDTDQRHAEKPKTKRAVEASAPAQAETAPAPPQDQGRALAEFTTEEIDAEYRRRHNVTFDRRTYMRDYMRKRRLTVVMPG